MYTLVNIGETFRCSLWNGCLLICLCLHTQVDVELSDAPSPSPFSSKRSRIGRMSDASASSSPSADFPPSPLSISPAHVSSSSSPSFPAPQRSRQRRYDASFLQCSGCFKPYDISLKRPLSLTYNKINHAFHCAGEVLLQEISLQEGEVIRNQSMASPLTRQYVQRVLNAPNCAAISVER